MRRIRWCLALALLVAGCSGSSSHHQAIGVPPQKVAGIYICPDGAEFVAYGHSVYPPNYPTPPARTVPPSRCFASMEQAARAGYGLARPPRGGRVVGGVTGEAAGITGGSVRTLGHEGEHHSSLSDTDTGNG